MEVFILMYIALLLIWALSNVFKVPKRKWFVCLSSFFVLWLIQALRDVSIGTDLVSYLPTFNRSLAIDPDQELEKGFYIFNYLINANITKSENVYLAIISLVFLLPVTFIIGQFSKNPALSFIIFASFVIYIFSFSALRQSIAIGLTTLSYYFVSNRKLVPSIGLVLLASTFHSSAIIFLIIYPLCNYVHFTKTVYLIASISMAVLVMSLSSVLDVLLPLLFEDGHYASYYAEETAPAYNLLILLCFFFLITFLVKKLDKTARNMRLMLFLSACCQTLGLISPVAPRVGFYFFAFVGIALANLTVDWKTSTINKNILECGIASFMIFFFFYNYTGGYLEVMPYKFFWE